MKKIQVILLLLPGCLAEPMASAEDAATYYHLRQGVTFYVANPAGISFAISVDIKDINTFCQGAQTLLLKVYDPDGLALYNEDVPDDGIVEGGYQQAWAGWDHELWARGASREIGAEPFFRWETFSSPQKLEKIRSAAKKIAVDAGKKGVYQIQMAGCDDHFVKLELTPNLRFGVLGHPDFIVGHKEQFSESYLCVPERPFYVHSPNSIEVWIIEHGYPRTRKLSLYFEGKALPIEDVVTHVASPVLTPGQALGRGRASLEGVSPGSVLKLAIGGRGDFLLRISGIPAILCPDQQTAEFIAGGIVRATGDGPLTSFAFQRELWEAVRHLQAQDFHAAVPPGEWFKPAAEQLASITLFSWRSTNEPAAVDGVLKNVDTLLHKVQPFNLLKFFEGLNLGADTLHDLSLYYLYPFQGNRLYHDAGIRNLITLGLVKAWMHFRCGEVIYAPGELNVAYAQGFGWGYWEPLWNMKEELDPRVLKAFQKGVSQMAERMYYANGLELVLSNGRTTIPLNLYHAYRITDDEKLRDLSRRYFRRMMTALDGPHSGWSPSGYFREHFGPDGGYCTYPLYQLGRLYLLSGDPEVLDTLDRMARWICYVTSPADGGLTGPTSWNSRIAMSPIEHLWGSGYRYFANRSEWGARLYRRLEAAGAYDVPDPLFDDRPVPEKKTLLLAHLTRGVLPRKPLPAESEGSFFEDVGGGHEFFAVRRGIYYAMIFAGNRPPFWMDTGLGGNMCYNGGGLTGLSLQGAGTVLLGRTAKEYGWPIEEWAALTVPVAVGQLSDGRFFNTGVSRNEVFPDSAAWSLRVAGEAISAPVNYERRYVFDEDRIHAAITVRNADLHRDVFQYRSHFRKPHQSIRHAWEIIPYRAAAGVQLKAVDVEDKELAGLSEQAAAGVSAVDIRNARGGVRVKFDQPRAVKLSRAVGGSSLSRSLQVQIASDLPPDQQAEFTYEIVPY